MKTTLRIQRGPAIFEEKHDFPGDNLIKAMRLAADLIETRNQARPDVERDVLLSVRQVFERPRRA